jgi:hypothetical protein
MTVRSRARAGPTPSVVALPNQGCPHPKRAILSRHNQTATKGASPRTTVASSAGSLFSSALSVTPSAPGDGSHLTSNFNDSTSSDGRCPGWSFDFSCISARTLAFAHLAGPPINPPSGREPVFDESFASTIDRVRVPPCAGSFDRGGGRPGITGGCFRLGCGQKVWIRGMANASYIQYETLKDFRVGVISTARYSAHPRVRILSA